MENKQQINLEHQKKALELLGILLTKEELVSSGSLLELHQERFGTDFGNEKNVISGFKTLKGLLGEDVVESKRGKGFQVKEKLKENYFWISSLISRSLSLLDLHSLDYIFEPLVHQLKNESLLNLLLCIHAMNTSHTIFFEYSKYNEENFQKKKLEIYGLAQRDTKFEVIGRDIVKKEIRHYFLSGMRNIKIEFEEIYKKPEGKFLEEYFKDTIGNYKSGKIENVVIKFSKESKNFIYKEYFQKNQKIEKKEDESYLVFLKAQSKQEIFNIVSKFIEYSELIEPKEWREEYIKKLENQLKKHKKI